MARNYLTLLVAHFGIAQDDKTPYLNAMIRLSSISSKVWLRVATADAMSKRMSPKETMMLDHQVMQWRQSIPVDLQYVDPGVEIDGQPLSRSNQRLRVVLYLRANQMRILIGRPILQTAASIAENSSHAHTIVEVAKDTIRVLRRLDQATDLYRTQQVMFNYFLLSALAVLFLAVSHAPAEFGASCRDEFYKALDLVRNMSVGSYVGQRLWRTIKGLKEVAPKLGFNLRANTTTAAAENEAHSNAAVAMAGLAGQNVDVEPVYGNGGQASLSQRDSLEDMANDLTTLFEAAGVGGGIAGYHDESCEGDGSVLELAGGNSGEGLGGLGGQEELARILTDWF